VAPLLLVALLSVDLAGIVLGPPGGPDCDADVALVMGAAQYDGRPSPAFERRLQEALALHETGCVARIVVSGGARPGDRSSEGASGVAWLRARGVPEKALAAETTARTSAENLAASRELLGEGPVVIVTDRPHAWRSLWLARRTGLTASAAVAPVRSGRLRYAARELTAMAAYRLGVPP
jgi:uncharacterized SAM-binding protein YcdF (DUF218 family)